MLHMLTTHYIIIIIILVIITSEPKCFPLLILHMEFNSEGCGSSFPAAQEIKIQSKNTLCIF